ncbi:MAG: four helix bundle protein [Rubricoccaceae bacterium]|nr:four helix bundle protein [Rubricoccaceae bacterium]
MSDVEQWERNVSPAIRGDALWKVKAYRLALYLGDVGWIDVSRLYRDMRTRSLADQLYRALGSVGANIAEGYSRGGGRDRVRFYEYALGSAREARHWYHQARHVLDEETTAQRIEHLTGVTRLLLTMIPDQRSTHLREPVAPYDATPPA